MYLNCKTYYSLRYGTISTRELVSIGAEKGISSMALTNINNTCDAWEFVQYCRQKKIKPILGAEIRNENKLLFILIAANNKGFKWINEFISDHLLNHLPFPESSGEDPFFLDTWDGFVIYPLSNIPAKKLFSNEWIGVSINDLTKIHKSVSPLSHRKMVIRQPVTLRKKEDYTLHTLLRAIDKNALLSKLPAGECCGKEEYFISPYEILQAFKDDPDIITNTCTLIDSCFIDMDFGVDKNKKVFGSSQADDREFLSKLTYEGLINRYSDNVPKDRIERELSIIDQLGFNAYFLIVWDVIRYARSKGYYHVGRGSGANSIVAYCLGITDVDPIELDLYFERFLNPYRTSPPDFDIDFSWADRDDVIDYVFKRYGHDHVVLLGMHTTFQYNSIVRELGKVIGLPKAEMDSLVDKGYYKNKGEQWNQSDHVRKTLMEYKHLEHFPNHLSIHSGGILISEKSIYEYTSVHMPPKGFPTSHINMHVAEEIGLFKLDILSQRGLGHIKDCLNLVKQNQNVEVDIHEIEKFKQNKKVREHIKSGHTIGCFYIESPAMRHVLKKLRCEDYLTLVAASSIIRPGVGEVE